MVCNKDIMEKAVYTVVLLECPYFDTPPGICFDQKAGNKYVCIYIYMYIL